MKGTKACQGLVWVGLGFGVFLCFCFWFCFVLLFGLVFGFFVTVGCVFCFCFVFNQVYVNKMLDLKGKLSRIILFKSNLSLLKDRLPYM